MKIRVITLDGLIDEVFEVTFFEFRSNTVDNFVRIWTTNGEKMLINRIAVIELVEVEE